MDIVIISVIYKDQLRARRALMLTREGARDRRAACGCVSEYGVGEN